MIDPTPCIGTYPWRHVPHPDPEILLQVLSREGIEGAWVGHLPSAFYRDPGPGNEELFARLAPFAPTLLPVPTIRPDWPSWRESLSGVVSRGAVAVRAYPAQWGLGPDAREMIALGGACAAKNVPLILTVRFEDARQRHPRDVSGDLSAAAIRSIARARTGVNLLITGAGRDLIEETHWGLTPEERDSVYWDISWIWGPPEDHLAHLFRTLGPERFVFGTMWPLRLTQVARASLELLPDELQGVRLADPRTWSRR